MRPGLNLAISTIRAWNDISSHPRIVAPHNSTRTQIVFHNPGSVDIFVAPVIVVHDPGERGRSLQPLPAAPEVSGQPWPYDWPYLPDQGVEQPSPARPWLHQIQVRRPVDAPPIPVGNQWLVPSQTRRGGCIQVFGGGGDCCISGNVTMAWQAFSSDDSLVCGGGGNMTVVGPDVPPNPILGQLWWNTNDPSLGGGQLYVWIGNEWVAASCCSGSDQPIVPQPPPTVPPEPPLLGNPLTVIELT